VTNSGIRVSKNITLTGFLNGAAASATAFCLQADPGTKGSHVWVYKSDAGGLQAPNVTSCGGSYATTM
jgi:hypothetical protein